jgi:hypothetical protein
MTAAEGQPFEPRYLGSAPTTSPRPPAFAAGKHSALTWRIFMQSFGIKEPSTVLKIVFLSRIVNMLREKIA